MTPEAAIQYACALVIAGVAALLFVVAWKIHNDL